MAVASEVKTKTREILRLGCDEIIVQQHSLAVNKEAARTRLTLSSQKKQCVLITLVHRCFWYCAAGIHTPPQTHERVNNSLLAGCSAAPIQGQQQPKHGPRQLAETRICRMELSSQKHLLAKFLYSVPREKIVQSWHLSVMAAPSKGSSSER